MADPTDRKLFLGPRLRMLRRDLGLSQTQMAEEMGISPSYLNHLERNQRPMTAQMLLRLANTYDIDMRDFMSGSTDAAIGNLSEMLSDPLVRDVEVARQEIIDIAENYPGIGEVLGRFYRALSDLRREPDIIERMNQGIGSAPLDWLRDFLQGRHNHFPEIDAAMEELAGQLPEDSVDLYLALRKRLGERHNISVRVVPSRLLDGAYRQYDLHRRRLMLSEMLPQESRLFALAWQLAHLEGAEIITRLAGQAEGASPENRALLRLALGNYAAAALLMPYGRFHAAARETRHNLPLLQARFGVSLEQLFHRLTTLGRSGERGIPFFMLKVDQAGNVAKRFAGDFFPFAMFGGACPRWNLYSALHMPNRLFCQLVDLPDGKNYVTLSQAIIPASGRPVAIALGCERKYAERICHADGLDDRDLMQIGPACHLCERPRCPDRTMPPVNRTLEVDPNRRDLALYPFRRV